MNTSFKCLALSLTVTWLLGTGAQPAASETAPVAIAADGQPHCVVEKRRGKRHQLAVPARVPVYWREMPLGIGCGTEARPDVQRTLRMPRDRWLPVTIVMNDRIMISLDPKPGYRFRKPARMTLTFYSRTFDSVEDRDRWYNQRKTKIEESTKARLLDIERSGPSCRYDSSCGVFEDEINERKAAQLKELDRLKSLTKVRPPGTPARKPASVTINEGGKKHCLVKADDGTWRSRPCAPQKGPKIRKIRVNGKDECIVQVNPTTWEPRPCP